jgi:hypothetical protein
MTTPLIILYFKTQIIYYFQNENTSGYVSLQKPGSLCDTCSGFVHHNFVGLNLNVKVLTLMI